MNESKQPALSDDSGAFRLLVESVKDYAIFLLNTKGYVKSWNTGAERMKGYTAKSSNFTNYL